jgi:hypothetical protein
MAEFEESEPEHFRWVAVVTYRAEAGPIEIDHHFEELEELQGIIERGPGLEHDRDDCRAVEPGARPATRSRPPSGAEARGR